MADGVAAGARGVSLAEPGMYEFELAAGDVAVDVGAYRGEWAAGLRQRHPDVWIHCYEPNPAVYWPLKARFSGDDRVVTFEIAVWSSWDWGVLKGADDSASFEPLPLETPASEITLQHIRATPVSEVLGTLNRCSLLKLNCEGGEYEILPALLALDRTRWPRYLLVQWHGPEEQTEALRTRLCEAYDMIWTQPGWEKWEYKASL